MPYAFFGRILDTWDEYLDLKYDYQNRLDRYMKEGMNFEDAHYKAQDEVGLERSP